MRISSRLLARPAAAAAVAAAMLLALAIPAAAHVRVTADSAARGGYATLEFSVPNESETKALTTELTVQLPSVGSASTELIPGWTATVGRDPATGVPTSVTWKAAPGNGIGPDQFALFRVRVKLPDADAVTFPATQTYSDGQVVRWDQVAPAGGPEPEHPAPALALTGEHADHDAHSAHAPQVTASPAQAEAHPSSTSDNTARWLGGLGFVLGAAGLGLALGTRLRKQR